MRTVRTVTSSSKLMSASSLALAALTSAASAGGFALNEQSTVFMGSASAGAAAGGSIGSMYWNPAATAALPGLNTESSYFLILPQADVHVNGGDSSGNVAIDAATSGSFGTYQVSKDFWLGMAVNSPFGTATKPENTTYDGSILGLTTKLIMFDANPTFAYRIAPGVTIGAGVQIAWAQGKLQFDETGTFVPPPNAVGRFLGTDWAFGATAGIIVEPTKGTTLGLGYRSRMDLDLKGSFGQPLPLAPTIPAGSYNGTGSLNLPDLVTASFRHEISPDMRLLGTVEWQNWSRFKSLDLVSVGVGGRISVPANWSDGWFFSLGGEYDYSPLLTLRSGVAYELSPEDDATKRFTTIPDNNRVWLNLGASYKLPDNLFPWSQSTTIDVAYAHIFVQDGGFERAAVNPALPVTLSGKIDASCDLVSVGMRTQW
jgi:long-chain fatty acid transport protein